jgi:CheY-like chemotaxis protein
MGIVGNISLGLTEVEVRDPVYKRLKAVERLVRIGSRLTNQLLGYAREGRYEVRPINLNRLVMETVIPFGETRKDVVIHLDLTEDLAGIEGDRSQIQQTLFNLCANAADAMPDGGELFVETRNTSHTRLKGKAYTVSAGEYVWLRVRDTGLGMDPETLERVFEPFFSSRNMGEKTGLGLSYVYGIVKSHGGYIDVISEEGRGAIVDIYLPASEKELAVEKPLEKEPLRGSGTILLVDDERMILDVGRKMISKLGYEVIAAESGKEAIQIYRKMKERIDLVILDMIMPWMGGDEVFDELKEMDPEVKVLLATGFSIKGLATELLKRGCKGLIQKPFDLVVLSENIKAILEGKESQKGEGA